MLPGTGTSKHVSNALTTGSSTRMEFVSQSLINALLSIILELVNLAIKVTILRTENAAKHQLSKSPMSDVLPGTGTSKSVFSAQTTGFSTITTFVSPFLISAPPSIIPELADHATEATT